MKAIAGAAMRTSRARARVISTTAPRTTETDPMASAALAWAFGPPILHDSEPVFLYRAVIQAFVDALVAARKKLFYKNYYK